MVNYRIFYFLIFFIALKSGAQTGLQNQASAAGTIHAVNEVLFATNEDCDFFVNNEPKGQLLKKEHLYLKLPAGGYMLRARSKSTGDELQYTVQVKNGGLNEFFIDLLYFVDERKKERDLLKTVNSAARVDNSVKENSGKKVSGSREAELAVVNMLAVNMAPVKGGRYIMGNNKAPATDEVEHSVTISDVWFGKYEVTQAQWEAIMGYNPSENKDCSSCPVENVSWEEVMKFIRKINLVSDKKFRLPTEAEWEYVAKMGGRAEIEKAGGQEAYIKNTAWYFGNSDKKTHPVGQKQPTIAGVYDLFGNVSEWCSDWYGAYYYREDDSQVNPEGPPLGKDKVVRGGSYLDYSGDRFRPSLRDKQKPTIRSKSIGFRLVLEKR